MDNQEYICDCDQQCDRLCWRTIDWRSISAGVVLSLLQAVAMVLITISAPKLPIRDLIGAVMSLVILLIFRAWFTARLVTFLLHSDNTVENCLALVVLSAIPCVAEVMYLCSSKGGKTVVRAFPAPCVDLSAFAVAQEIRKKEFAKATGDNTLTIYMDRETVDVQINEESHSIFVYVGEEKKEVNICCFDDAKDLANTIINEINDITQED